MPSATLFAGVGDLGEVAEQVTALLGRSAAGTSSRWAPAGMGMMEGQARSSGLLMGFDNHLIARSCACPFIHPAHSPDYHQPDKPAQCRGPGRCGKVTGRVEVSLLPTVAQGVGKVRVGC
jgi:hypothetical protein